MSTRVAKCFPSVNGVVTQSSAAYLLDPTECNDDNTNYWIFSDAGLRRIVDRTGWQVRAYLHAEEVSRSNPVDATRDERAYCLLQSSHLRAWRKIALLEGWYETEPAGFRWTHPTFSLRPEESGELRALFYVPDVLLAAESTLLLSARESGRLIGEMEIRQPGAHQFACTVRAQIDVHFTTSVTLRSDHSDPRERGIVVGSMDVY